MNPHLPHYCIIVDNATQSLIKIAGVVQTSLGEKMQGDLNIPRKVEDSPFFKNLMNRDLSFAWRKLGNDHWFGWHISSDEFFRIKRMCELEPIVAEFEILAKHEKYI